MICRFDLLFLRTRSEPSPEVEDCPFCGTTIRPGAIVCSACGAFKGKRMGCTGCLALIGAVLFSFGVLAMLVTFAGSQAQDSGGFVVFVGLLYAGLAALCCWALVRIRRQWWYRRM